MKSSLYFKMHEHDLASKPLYKLHRLLLKHFKENEEMWIQFYELMAKQNQTKKETMVAHEYYLKAAVLQDSLGKYKEDKAIEKKMEVMKHA